MISHALERRSPAAKKRKKWWHKIIYIYIYIDIYIDICMYKYIPKSFPVNPPANHTRTKQAACICEYTLFSPTF